MSGECDSCGEHALECRCWNETKHILPPLGEVIEGIGPEDWSYSNLGRDYFALVKIKSKLIWVTPLLNDMDYRELEITHWRHVDPDPKGKKPFVKIKMSNGCWEPIVIFN